MLPQEHFSMYQVGAEAMLPPREITVSQWADENVVLTGRLRRSVASGIRGRTSGSRWTS